MSGTSYPELPLAFVKAKSSLLTFARYRSTTLYDEFEEHGINDYVQNITMLKCAKITEIGLRHFEDISRRCEPSNVVAYFLANRVCMNE